MAQVVVRLKVLPSDVDVDLDKLASEVGSKLPDGVSLRSSRQEPIAFGLSALIIDVLLQEMDGAMEKLEQAVTQVEHVGQIEVIGVSRLSTRL